MASEAGGVAGSMTGAAGSLYQGQAQSDALQRAADIQRQNAALDIESSQANADRQMISANQKIGAATTGYAASGVTGDSGSAMDVLAASHANAELDKQNILHGGIVRATNYNNQAAMDETGAESAMKGSYLNAVSSIVMGGSKAFGQGAGANTQYNPMSDSSGGSEDGVESGAVDDSGMAGGAGDAAAGDDILELA